MRLATLLLLTLLLTACGAGRKVTRDKAKAQKHLAKAVWLDPSILKATEQEVELPGDSVVLPPVPYADVDLDSLVEACAEVNRTLQRERDQLAHQLMALPGKGVVPPKAPNQAVQSAVHRLREQACRYAPFTYDHELFTITASGGSTPNVEVSVKPRKASVPCPPQVDMQPVIKVGVASWYRTFFWWVVSMVLLGVLGAVRFAMRHHAGP